MENTVSCHNENPQLFVLENMPPLSFTHLGGLEGAPDTCEGNIYGAQFMSADMKTPYYERTISTNVKVPWLAQSEEATYMNRTKPLNEDPVLTYKELKLKSIPNDYSYIEQFGENTQNFVFKILTILFIILLIYYLLTKIN